MTDTLFFVALVAWAAGAAVDLGLGAERRFQRVFPFACGLVGSGVSAAAGIQMTLGLPRTVDLGPALGVGETMLRLDPLAGMFLTLVGALGVVVSACLMSWSAPLGRVRGRGTGAGYLLLLGAVAAIIVAADAFTFLFAWEALTVAFYLLVGIRRPSPVEGRASWVTLGVGKLSGTALLFGFLLLARTAHSYDFSAWSSVTAGSFRDAAFALLVVGFGAKVGLVPFQVWLPIGYPTAPGPLRAALAGIAVNVGFYGLWRFLGLLGRPPIWLAGAVLVAGGATALVGVVFAAVESRLNRLLAYSSVENGGVILVGYGVALAGAATHRVGVVAAGLLAATLQVLAHAVAKTSLFASSSFLTSGSRTDELERLRGLGRIDGFSAATFSLGSVTLAGLPPTIGFVSEWFILEALMQEFRIHALALRLAMALAGALVALTAGVALLCFVRLLGLVVFGKPALSRPARAVDGCGFLGSTARSVVGASCLGLAAAAPWVIRFIADGLSPVVPYASTAGGLKGPWVLQPVFANFSILSPSWLFVVLPIGLVSVAGFALVASRKRLLHARRVPAWRSATPGVAEPSGYTPFGFANALRHVLVSVLGSRRSVVMTSVSPIHKEAETRAAADRAHLEIRTEVFEPVETYLYRPAGAVWFWLSRRATRLQSGRLDAYVGYMLVTLLIVLALVAAMN